MAIHFKDSEITGLQPQLVDMLDKAREFAGVPFLITSGLRTHDECVRLGTPNSAHQRGLAVDLRCADSFTRFQMVRGLIFAGFNRIEAAPAHLHADIDQTLPQNVLFLGTDA